MKNCPSCGQRIEKVGPKRGLLMHIDSTLQRFERELENETDALGKNPDHREYRERRIKSVSASIEKWKTWRELVERSKPND